MKYTVLVVEDEFEQRRAIIERVNGMPPVFRGCGRGGKTALRLLT